MPGDAVVCDQAIYTSIRSASRRGYGVIASSCGIRECEMGEIIRRTPAVGGLCLDDPAAVGISFFALSSGRCAALYTCHAGREPSGRGDRRTYTRIVVLDKQGLGRFRNNAFAVLRAAEVAGGLEVALSPARQLPPLTLHPEPLHASVERPSAFLRDETRSVIHVIDAVLSGRPMVITAAANVLALTETLICLLPAPLRPSVSFSAGMPFTMSRDHRLVVVPADAGPKRSSVEGTPYVRLDVSRGMTETHACHHAWVSGLERWLALDEAPPAALSWPDRVTDADMTSIEQIGRLWGTLADVRSTDFPGLTVILERVGPLTPPTPLGQQLAERLMQEVEERFTMLIPHADEESLAGLWGMISGLTPRSSESARQLGSVVTCAVCRMSQLNPRRAIETALDAADNPCCSIATADWDRAKAALADSVASWLEQAPGDALSQMESLVETWCRRFPDDPSASRLQSALADRMAATHPVT